MSGWQTAAPSPAPGHKPHTPVWRITPNHLYFSIPFCQKTWRRNLQAQRCCKKAQLRCHHSFQHHCFSSPCTWVNLHGPRGGNFYSLPTAEFNHNCLHFLRGIGLSLFPLQKMQVITVLYLPKELEQTVLPTKDIYFNPKYKIAGIPTQPKNKSL